MTETLWTPADLAILHEMYPTSPVADIAARLERTAEAIYKAGRKAKLTRAAVIQPMGSPRMTEIMNLAARPGGVHPSEVSGNQHTAASSCGRLKKRGELFTAGTWRHVRFFATQAAADAYAATRPVAQKVKRKAEIHREGWQKDAPAFYPVDAKGRPLYKITVSKAPPRALRSNQYLQFT